MAAVDPPLELLYVVNNRLPASDYRVAFGRASTRANVWYGLPEPPPGIPEDRWIPLGFGEGLAVRDLRTFVELFRVLRARRADLDWVHFYATSLVVFGPPLARLAGVRALVTVTGTGRSFTDDSPLFRLARLVFRPLFRLSARCSDAVLFQNRGDLAALGAWLRRDRAKVRYIGSAVQTPEVGGDRERGVADRPVRVLLVSRIMTSKGVQDFLAVAERLAGPDLEFVLVGPRSTGQGTLDDDVDAAARNGTIRYLGPRYGDELMDEYARADLFFFPSRSEGMARVLLEAGQLGLVPVAYDIPANRDVVVPGSGELLTVGDLDGVVATIRRYADDPDLRRRSSREIRRHCRTTFGIDAYVARMDDVLDSLVRGDPGRSAERDREAGSGLPAA